ncbi:endonuclease domain-containing protein [Desulfosporosinus youngiae]|nr:DUF559 domain-containing protein [Desulfosporosinus youngiae]
MNKIEEVFFNAYNIIEKTGETDISYNLESQVVVGIYKVDFVYGCCAIEIDGHEYHKTKEQREVDYKRERYLLRHGYTPIRFTGTEVFLDAKKCVLEMLELGESINIRDHTYWLACKEHGINTVWWSPMVDRSD